MKGTKSCNFKKICVCAWLSAICGFFAVAQEHNWSLAGYKFSYTQKNISSKMSDSVAISIPSLILEQIAENLHRKPRAQELLDRKSYDFRKERLSLFLQLSKEVKNRDAIFLQNYSKGRLKRKLKESDAKIAKIHRQIDENLDAEKKSIEKFSDAIKKDEERDKDILEGKTVLETESKNTFAQFFKSDDDEIQSAPLEKIVLYGNDSGKLFVFSDVQSNVESSEEDLFQSYQFQKACVDSRINGLITGNITVYGSYISVQAKLYQYPGARVIGYAVETGMSDDIDLISKSIAMQLTPKIAQSMPVEIEFNVESDDALSTTSLAIDDVIYKTVPQKVRVQSGPHSILFFADGYKSVSMDYSFTGNRRFNVSVKMEKKNYGEVNIAVLKNLTGSLFVNGVLGGKIDPKSQIAKIKLDGKLILGHFIDEEGLAADFYVPQNLMAMENLKVNLKAFDKSKYIDVRRRWMYASYSALIVSLVPAFYCYGNHVSSAKAYNDGAGMSYETARKWETASNICVGISAGCGALFLFELFRYLKAANSVIPTKAKKISSKELTKIQLRTEKDGENQNHEEEKLDTDGKSNETDMEKGLGNFDESVVNGENIVEELNP